MTKPASTPPRSFQRTIAAWTGPSAGRVAAGAPPSSHSVTFRAQSVEFGAVRELLKARLAEFRTAVAAEIRRLRDPPLTENEARTAYFELRSYFLGYSDARRMMGDESAEASRRVARSASRPGGGRVARRARAAGALKLALRSAATTPAGESIRTHGERGPGSSPRTSTVQGVPRAAAAAAGNATEGGMQRRTCYMGSYSAFAPGILVGVLRIEMEIGRAVERA